MWHLRSLKPLSVQEFDDSLFIPNVCRIHDNQVIICVYLFIATLLLKESLVCMNLNVDHHRRKPESLVLSYVRE